jgi:hypothetical protein
MTHTCGWGVNDGEEGCGEPATKSVVCTLTQMVGYETRVIWLCDLHYSDPGTRAWWDYSNVDYRY